MPHLLTLVSRDDKMNEDERNGFTMYMVLTCISVMFGKNRLREPVKTKIASPYNAISGENHTASYQCATHPFVYL